MDTYFTFYGSDGLPLFYNFSSTIGFIMLYLHVSTIYIVLAATKTFDMFT